MHTPRRFWKIVALTALSLGFFGILRLYWGAAHWKNELPLEGLIALYAGVIAFVAVMIQLEEERNARVAEHERQRRALATAILIEIDHFYVRHLIDRAEGSKVWRQLETNPRAVEVFKLIVGKPAAIFEASADKLGELDEKTSRAIIASYGASAAYLELMKYYQDLSAKGPMSGSLPERKALQVEITRAGDQATQFACWACQLLCELTGTSFSTLMIASESCAHTDTVEEQVTTCISCNKAISRSINAKKN